MSGRCARNIVDCSATKALRDKCSWHCANHFARAHFSVPRCGYVRASDFNAEIKRLIEIYICKRCRAAEHDAKEAVCHSHPVSKIRASVFHPHHRSANRSGVEREAHMINAVSHSAS